MLEHLLDADAVDSYRAVTQQGDHVLIPLRRPDVGLPTAQASIVEAPLDPSPRRAPIDRVRERLRGQLPDRVIGAVPERWSQLGEVLLLRVPEALTPHETTVAAAFGQVLDVRAVLALEGTQGRLREPVTRHLWGDKDTETVHREDGIGFHLDPAAVLFSAGNHHERHRLRRVVDPGERVVDLFAGIGYFSLPLGLEGANVTACELNPTATSYLRRNVDANELGERIEIREGDCRQVAPTGVADRVLMGYFPGTRGFLPTALDALSPQGGTIHYHAETQEPDGAEEAWRELADHPALEQAAVELVSSRRVKTTGPGRAHVVLDVEVRP